MFMETKMNKNRISSVRKSAGKQIKPYGSFKYHKKMHRYGKTES